MTTAALVLASLALTVACTTLGLVLTLMRQSARTASTLRRHRIAHADTHGAADPGPARRRGAGRYNPPTGYMPALTRDHLDDPTAPPPGYVTDDDDELDTVESPTARPRPLPGQEPAT